MKNKRELPWLMTLPKEKEDADARDFFRLSVQKIHTVRIPGMHALTRRFYMSLNNGWMLTVDFDLDIRLYHPWYDLQLQLPPWETLNQHYYVKEDPIQDIYIFRAALSDDGNMVVIIYGCGGLGFCRIGDEAWTNIDANRTNMSDVIYHEGRFYVVNSWTAAVYLLRMEDGFAPRLKRLTEDLNPSIGVSFLAPDILTDSIFVIHRLLVYANNECRVTGVRFDIYRTSVREGECGEKLNEFRKVESLGDLVLFLGYNAPITVAAGEYSGLKGNRIYFAEALRRSYYYFDEPCGSDVFVYNVEDETAEDLFSDGFCSVYSPPIWIATPPYSVKGDFSEKRGDRTHRRRYSYGLDESSGSGVSHVKDETVEQFFPDRFHSISSPPLEIVTPPYSSERDFLDSLEKDFFEKQGNQIYYRGSYLHGLDASCGSGVFNVKDETVGQLFPERFHPISSPPLAIATPPYPLEGDFQQKQSSKRRRGSKRRKRGSKRLWVSNFLFFLLFLFTIVCFIFFFKF